MQPSYLLEHLIKHKETHHSFQAIDSKTTSSSVVAQMDASDLNFRRDVDDDRDTNVNGWGSPKDVKDCDTQSLAENVGVYNNFACTFLH